MLMTNQNDSMDIKYTVSYKVETSKQFSEPF